MGKILKLSFYKVLYQFCYSPWTQYTCTMSLSWSLNQHLISVVMSSVWVLSLCLTFTHITYIICVKIKGCIFRMCVYTSWRAVVMCQWWYSTYCRSIHKRGPQVYSWDVSPWSLCEHPKCTEQNKGCRDHRQPREVPQPGLPAAEADVPERKTALHRWNVSPWQDVHRL